MSYCTAEDLERDPWLLANLPGDCQTDALSLAAVRAHGCVLQYVYRQTPAICLAAVLNDGLALQFVKKRTALLALTAVRNNGSALRYVEEQTPAICLAAVTHNPFALRYVRCQTADIVVKAIQGFAGALSMVKLPHDNLVDPHSGQLDDWLRVLRVCRKASMKTTAQVLYPLLDNLSCGPANRDEWLQIAPDGRYQLDHLVDLVIELKSLSPRDGRIERMYHRVHQQVERCFSDARWGDYSAHEGPAFDPAATL